MIQTNLWIYMGCVLSMNAAFSVILFLNWFVYSLKKKKKTPKLNQKKRRRKKHTHHESKSNKHTVEYTGYNNTVAHSKCEIDNQVLMIQRTPVFAFGLFIFSLYLVLADFFFFISSVHFFNSFDFHHQNSFVFHSFFVVFSMWMIRMWIRHLKIEW